MNSETKQRRAHIARLHRKFKADARCHTSAQELSVALSDGLRAERKRFESLVSQLSPVEQRRSWKALLADIQKVVSTPQSKRAIAAIESTPHGSTKRHSHPRKRLRSE